jgi:acetyl-CoA synthetase
MSPQYGDDRYREAVAAAEILPPSGANLAHYVCDRHAQIYPAAPALVLADPDAEKHVLTFRALEDLSRRFAAVLTTKGFVAGDRLAVLLGQGAEFPIAVIACWRIGVIAVPVPGVFAGAGLAHRIEHSGCRGAVADAAGLAALEALPETLARLEHLWSAGPAGSFWRDIGRAQPVCGLPAAGGETPALIIYTSGTTGRAKGVVHSHEGVIASMAGVRLIYGDIHHDDLAWAPVDWSWIAGLTGLLFAFLFYGQPVLALRAPQPFDPAAVVDILRREQVRCTLLTPTMLRLIQQSGAGTTLPLRSLMATGEPVGEELFRFCSETLGVTPAAAYGQTECAPIAFNHPRFMAPRPGALGLPTPGLEVQVVDALGNPVAPGEVGEITVRRRHPRVFGGYWDNPAATADRLRGEWMLTGDEARQDPDGMLWFVGRNDDVIKSSGYRIGPAEIEARLAEHPSVELVGVIGLAHATRGEEVSAVVTLKPGESPSLRLAEDLLAFGAARLERHERPRRVIFVDRMPLTVTGKLMRKTLRQQLTSRGQTADLVVRIDL